MSILPSDEFDFAIVRNWADHFRCPITTILESGTTLLPANKYAGDKLILLWQIGKHTFAEHDPAYRAALERILASLPPGSALSAVNLVRSWGPGAFLGQDAGLIHYLYPPELPDCAPAAPFELRRLSLADAAGMEALHEANTPEDVADGYVEVTHEVAFGCFDGNQLVAAASGYRRAGFLDIGVLTHPAFRRKGLGKAAVGALCAWSSEQGLIAQYRCNTVNAASHALAQALNFRLLFHSEALWLAE